MTSRARLLLVTGMAVLLSTAIAVEARWREEASRRETQAALAGVQATFVGYRDAAAARQGEVAASHLAADSRDYFRDIYRETQDADAQRLQQLDPVRYLLVLVLRAMVIHREMDPAQLTPEALTALAFESGIIGREFDGSYGIGEIVIDGDRAAARLKVGDRLLERRVWFQRHDGDWGLDILPVLADWADSLQERAVDLGVAPDLVAEMTVEGFLTSTLDPELFQPLESLRLTHNTEPGGLL